MFLLYLLVMFTLGGGIVAILGSGMKYRQRTGNEGRNMYNWKRK
jgi:hypothetical protein